MMNTKIVGMVVAVIVVVGGGYYAMNQKGGSATEATGDMKHSPAFTGSVQDLATRGGDWKCTVSGSTDGTASNGIVYVSGNKLRADFMSTVPQMGNVESHIVGDGSDMYIWSSALPQGFRVSGSITQSGEGASQTGVDLSKSYSYDCQPLADAEALFVPPAEIVFTSF